MGDNEHLIQSMFQVAEFFGPTMIFIDELECLLASREQKGSSGSISMFLSQMSISKNIYLVGATNYPWTIDKAFYRRFSELIFIGLPNHMERRQLLEMMVKKIRAKLGYEDSVDLYCDEVEQLATKTNGFSAADYTRLSKALIIENKKKLFKATHFKKSEIDRNMFMPCSKHDKGSIECTYMDLDGKVFQPPITVFDFLHTLKTFVPSNTPESIEDHKYFNETHETPTRPKKA